MQLYQRYMSGEYTQVYKDIEALGHMAFSAENFSEIDKVLTETFIRLKYNLAVIYRALLTENYQFNTAPNYNFEKPLHPPLNETSQQLQLLDRQVSRFGFVPMSLKYFYTIVGGVNFAWDIEATESPFWELADPIQISSLDAVLSLDWQEDIECYVNDGTPPFIELSADALHKDNISGGMPYALEITSEKSIDARFLNEPNNTSFINYLRIVCDSCGFPAMLDDSRFVAFVEKVKPKLKPI